MTREIYSAFLLAQQGRAEDFARSLQRTNEQYGTDSAFYWLLIGGGVIVAAIALWYALKVWRQRFSTNSPAELFLCLCKAHKLKWSERWLLWRLGRSQHLADPARLFLEPGRLKAARLPVSLRQRGRELESIRGRLFSELKDSGKTHESGTKSAPKLDIPPWPEATSSAPPLPPLSPLTNSSDGAPV
jgi:hypothetical protein